MKWTIRTAGLEECEANGETAFDACVAAVKTYAPDGPLGLLMTATPEGSEEWADDMMIVSTERVLQEAGVTYKRKDGVPNMEPQQ